MINETELNNIMQWQNDNSDYPFFFEEETPKVLTAIGEDCEAFIEFLDTATDEMIEFLSQFIEAFTQKFEYDGTLMDKVESIWDRG